ncbi:uncharacterized protein Dana_GF20051 [Drosophila ananassae]|uniref:Acp25 n=1 Tax=Drosophila ananassae TaxID=7217 RepID=B3M709_DROAN|nr:gonadal protein gdl-ORF39 [Drosophila ananassae]EDV40874.1 uncharacterized protein Dana_GF20051 [Drosophila ananassae]
MWSIQLVVAALVLLCLVALANSCSCDKHQKFECGCTKH